MEVDVTRPDSSLASELYFLIAKFLSDGPCRPIADALKSELERSKILPQRLDWQGNPHTQSFEELERKYSHISPLHLLQICSRIGPVLEKEVPPCVPGALSLLGAGKQSLLRTQEDMMRFVHNISAFSGRVGGKPLMPNPPCQLPPLSIVKILQGRENSGPLTRREAVPSSFYNKMQLYRHTLGHLSAVYCVLFDRTGKYIITGADDLLVKVWSSTDGRLLATFRGASSEIMDIAVNFDNTLLAAGSLDKILRIWCFQTMSPIAVLSGHTGMITSVNFCPIPCNDVNYLVTTSSDGSVAFWAHTKQPGERTVFHPEPIQYHEKMRPGQAQMICASFSPGGAFMAAGSADHHVRVYMMLGDEGPKRVLEVEAHSDTVDSIQWAHSGLRFISGSKDGTANVWHFEQQQWQSTILIMSTKLAGETEPEEDSNKRSKVTMVSWDQSDEWVVTAVNDCSLKVWNAKTGVLVKKLKAHKDEIFVLESHPIDPRVILSAGHDGQLIIWDVLNNDPIAVHQNFIQGQGNGAIFDAKWSPDGTMIAATDSHGHLMIYGFGSGIERMKIVPKELFFHTDYRPLIRDVNNYVLDEQTQTAPHLMPPPFLVDVDGNPYPPQLQKLVPGRENCGGEQLVPNIAVGASGQQEVIEGLPEQEQPRSHIDQLIAALAQRRQIEAEGGGGGGSVHEDDQQQPNAARQAASPRGPRPGLRRAGDVEGVRQSSGNWQRDSTTPWNKPILARPLKPAVLDTQSKQVNAMAEMEMECYRREMRRKPQPISTSTPDQNSSLTRNKRKGTARHGYRTRAAREEEQEEEDFDNDDNSASSGSSNESSANEEELGSESSSSDNSSEYSDWIADHGDALEPPKRSKRKPVQKRPDTPPSDSDRRKNQRPKKKKAMPISVPSSVQEVPDIYRPPEWLSEVIPRKAPYYPQMGDDIVYFRQGHKRYLDVVKDKKIYEVNRSFEPWSKLDLQAQEFVKVVGIKYEIKPPRLCCLKLAQMDEEGHLTGKSFTIKYHDIPDVLDFLVLRQTFDNALDRNWSEGNRFRCMIDDGWWTGQIISVQPLSEDFPGSYFMCFTIRWDNGETEFMSPWDLEPIDEQRLPSEVGGAVPVLPEEIQETLYQPQPEEWPMGDRDAACQRIIRGLDQAMTLAIAEPFIAPVDLNAYPAYAYVVEYPIDLSTIKARFENRFYRRITSAQFDVRYLATNAEKFNEPHSQIVKQARLVTDICLKIIKNVTDHDITALYHELADAYHSSESEVDVEEDDINRPSTSTQRPTRSAPSRRPKTAKVHKDWRVACRQLLETLWQCEDSIPFREPVDRLEHPDYHQVIDTPMDLRTVKEDLLGGNYESPNEFAKDMKLIFTNSRSYNTNTRSKIYSMTVRLSAMFEEYMRKIMNNWKSANRRKTNSESKKSKKGSPTKSQLSNGVSKKSPTKRKAVTSEDDDDDESDDNEDPPMEHDEEDEEDDEVEHSEDSTPEKRPVRRVINLDEPGPSHLTNGHSKRSAAKSSRPALRPRNASSKGKFAHINSDDEDDDSDNTNPPTPSASDSSDDSSPKAKRRTRTRKSTSAITNGLVDSDSDDVYQPSVKGKQSRNHRAKNSGRVLTRPTRTPEKRYVVDDEDDEDEEEEEVQYNVDSRLTTRSSSRRQRRVPVRNQIEDSSNEEEEEDEDEEEEEDEEENAEVDNGTVEFQENDEEEEEEEEDEQPDVQVEVDEEQEDEEDEEQVEDGVDHNEDEDEEEIDEDDDDSRENNQSLGNFDHARSTRQVRRTRVSLDSESSSGANSKQHHLRRTATKRMRYTENSNSEDDDDDDDYEDENGRGSRALHTRRRAAKRPFYGEPSDEESSSQPGLSNGSRDSESKPAGISISSRGRVRKMTAKAMSALR